MRLRCDKCKTVYDFAQPRCTWCGRPTPGHAPARQSPPAITPKQRSRNQQQRSIHSRPQSIGSGGRPPKDRSKADGPAAFPAQFVGTLSISANGQSLSDGVKSWRVHVVSDVPAQFLVGHRTTWHRNDVEGHVVLVTPAPCAWLSLVRQRVEEAQARFLREKTGPRAEGSSSIERQRGLVKQAQEIERLTKVNKPEAWAEIASCWRLSSLRPAVNAALASIGWDKISWLVHATDLWPADFVAHVERERAHLHRARKGVPWHPADTYWLEDS